MRVEIGENCKVGRESADKRGGDTGHNSGVGTESDLYQIHWDERRKTEGVAHRTTHRNQSDKRQETLHMHAYNFLIYKEKRQTNSTNKYSG